MILATLGWLGAVCLAICGAPAAYKSYKDGHSNGLSGAFIALWLSGEIFTLGYVLGSGLGDSWPLITNYFANIILISIMVKYKVAPRI